MFSAWILSLWYCTLYNFCHNYTLNVCLYYTIHTGAVSTSGFYTEGQLSFGITDIHCNGTEDNFTSCSHNEAQLHNCQPHDDAGVICQGFMIPYFLNACKELKVPQFTS